MFKSKCRCLSAWAQVIEALESENLALQNMSGGKYVQVRLGGVGLAFCAGFGGQVHRTVAGLLPQPQLLLAH